MKSIVQEASSIEKAIFQAWQRAGQPEDFSIRIFEVPQKNFFGFTVKSAKIAIFFQEQPKKKEHTAKPAQQQPHAQQQQQPKPKAVTRPLPVQTPKAPQHREQKAPEPREVNEQQVAAKPKNDTPLWSPSMVEYAQKWLQDLFTLAEQKNIAFAIEPQKYHLKVTFEKAPFEDEERCRIFYRSCAHLLLQSLRNTCKRPLKGFKVICMHNA
jgi:predicted RNA-binding protein Jag